MAIERWRPLGTLMDRDPFRDIQSEMNRLFDSFLGRPTATETGAGGRLWMPVVDMYETQDELIVSFELPGVREKDISLSITGDMLTVKGERQLSEQSSDDNCLHMERVYGKFERSIRLPMPVQAGWVKATYRDGVLLITVQRRASSQPRRIDIQ